MKISLIYPTSGNPTQPFGANPAFYSNPIYGGINGHNGIDYLTNHGWPIYATHDGVANYEVDPSGGCGVVLMSYERDYKTIYWHLCDGTEPQFKSPAMGVRNLMVETGDIIGYADNTGASTGDHLHFGLKLCKDGVTLNNDNGMLGAIDPTPYFNGYSPEQFLKLKLKVSLLQRLVDLWKSLLGIK